MTKLCKPFDVLDGAITRHLQDIPDSYLRFTRYPEVEGAYVYYVAHYTYGKIELRKLDEQLCEFDITPPPPQNTDTLTAEERAEELVIYNREDGPRKQYATEEQRQNVIAAYARSIDGRREMLARHGKVLEQLIERLKQDGLFVEAGEAAQPAATASGEPNTPAPQAEPPAPQAIDLESQAKQRIIARGQRVTQKRLIRELDNIKIDNLRRTHDPAIIAQIMELEVDTVISRIKKMDKISP
jgi:hypothetical protein